MASVVCLFFPRPKVCFFPIKPFLYLCVTHSSLSLYFVSPQDSILERAGVNNIVLKSVIVQACIFFQHSFHRAVPGHFLMLEHVALSLESAKTEVNSKLLTHKITNHMWKIHFSILPQCNMQVLEIASDLQILVDQVSHKIVSLSCSGLVLINFAVETHNTLKFHFFQYLFRQQFHYYRKSFGIE